MERSEIFDKTVEICKEVFENEDIILNEESNASNVKEWDSLTHLSIISDLEDEFDVSFSLDEITNAKNLGELVDALMKHLEKQE